MTRLIGLALLALVGAANLGGNDGTPTHLRQQWGVDDGDSVLREVRANGVGLPAFTLRIHGLAADGIATPEPVATAEPATPEPTRDAPVYGAGVEQWRGMVASVFPAWAVSTALRIMGCESKGDANATGAQGERGLFQIHPRWHPDSTYDPAGNIRAAYRISKGGTDWSAWSCA